MLTTHHVEILLGYKEPPIDMQVLKKVKAPPAPPEPTPAEICYELVLSGVGTAERLALLTGFKRGTILEMLNRYVEKGMLVKNIVHTGKQRRENIYKPPPKPTDPLE